MPDGHQPVAVAVAAQQHGLVVLDKDTEVLRPAKLWNDTESAPDTEALLAALPGGADGWAGACGSVPVPSFTITKLHWLRRCEPETHASCGLRDAAPRLADLPAHRSAGHRPRATHRGPATGPRARSAIDTTCSTWSIVGVDWQGALPEVLAPDAAAGEWAATGRRSAPGTGDNMAAALGLGLRPGDLALSLGTSGTAFTVSDRAVGAIRPAPWPGSPTPRAASSRSCAP